MNLFLFFRIYTRTSYYYDFIISNMQFDLTSSITQTTSTTTRSPTTTTINNGKTPTTSIYSNLNISKPLKCDYGFVKSGEDSTCICEFL